MNFEKLTKYAGAFSVFRSAVGSPLFWLLVLSFTVRNIYHAYNSAVFFNGDSATYCYAAETILSGKLDVYRTPLYPIVIGLFRFLDPVDPFPNIILLQHFCSWLSIVPFYLLCKHWFGNVSISFLASLTYACLPGLLEYNYSYYPESLQLSFISVAAFLFCRYLTKPSFCNVILFNACIFLLVMLKPGCLFFYGVAAVILILRFIYEKNSAILKIELPGFLISVALLMCYCLINKKQNDFFGISNVTHDNNFANVVLSGAYKNFPDNRLIHIIDTMKFKGVYHTVFYLNDDHEKYRKSFDAFPAIYGFSFVIPPNEFGYSADGLSRYVTDAMFSKEYLNYVLNNFSDFFWFSVFHIKGGVIYLLVFIDGLALFYLMFRNKCVDWMRLFIFLSVVGIIATVLIFGVNDETRSRVITPLAPFIILMIFNLLVRFGYRISGYLYRSTKDSQFT